MKRLVVVLLMVLAGVLAACGSTGPTPMPVAEFSLTAMDIAYDVNRLEVTAGQPVKVILQNEGTLEHDFSIMEMPHAGEVMAEEAEDGMHSLTLPSWSCLARPSTSLRATVGSRPAKLVDGRTKIL